jgi:hypothetical protein
LGLADLLFSSGFSHCAGPFPSGSRQPLPTLVLRAANLSSFALSSAAELISADFCFSFGLGFRVSQECRPNFPSSVSGSQNYFSRWRFSDPALGVGGPSSWFSRNCCSGPSSSVGHSVLLDIRFSRPIQFSLVHRAPFPGLGQSPAQVRPPSPSEHATEFSCLPSRFLRFFSVGLAPGLV